MSALIHRVALEAADGVRVKFSLPSVAVAGTIRPLLQGVAVSALDFTEDSTTSFTLSEAPRAGDQVAALYEPTVAIGEANLIDTPIGTVDGANRLFSTPTAPYVAGEVRVIVNGIWQPPDAVTELDPALGTFQIDTDNPPDPVRDELLVSWLTTPGASDVVAGPITLTVETPTVVLVQTEE